MLWTSTNNSLHNGIPNTHSPKQHPTNNVVCFFFLLFGYNIHKEINQFQGLKFQQYEPYNMRLFKVLIKKASLLKYIFPLAKHSDLCKIHCKKFHFFRDMFVKQITCMNTIYYLNIPKMTYSKIILLSKHFKII